MAIIDPDTAPLPRGRSTSQISTYINCPRKYCYQYVLKIPVLVLSDALAKGSRVHAAIADPDPAELAPDEAAMVDRARRLLALFPPGAILETTYEDRNNPGRLYGEIAGEPFTGIFDVHWKDPSIAVDWKTGKYKPKYSTGLETQAYVLGELYEQQYDRPLEDLAFIFLKGGEHHHARALLPGRSRDAAAGRISTALDGIRARCFDKRRGPLCEYCEHKAICKMNVGFNE